MVTSGGGIHIERGHLEKVLIFFYARVRTVGSLVGSARSRVPGVVSFLFLSRINHSFG